MEQKIDGNIVNAIPMKPQILPFSNIDAIRMFKKEDSTLYNEVVSQINILHTYARMRTYTIMYVCMCVSTVPVINSF